MQRKTILTFLACLLVAALACQFPANLMEKLSAQKENLPSHEQSTILPPAATPDLPRTVYLSADGSGDYPSIEKAVDTLPANSTIMLAGGAFYLRGRLLINKSLNIIGSANEQTYIYASSQYGVMHFDGPGEFNLQNIWIEYQGPTQGHVIEIVDGTFRMDECVVKGGIYSEAENKGGSGIWVDGDSIGTIQNSRAFENQIYGIQIRGKSRVTLEHNIINQNQISGLSAFGGSQVVARYNEFRFNGGNGISANDTAEVLFENNITNENKRTGVVVTEDAYLEASYNESNGNGKYGFEARGNASYALINNTCLNNTESGFAVFDDTSGAFWGNYAAGNLLSGYAVYDQSYASVENSQSMENKEAGFLLAGTSVTDLYTNTAENNGLSGIIVRDNATATLEGNTTNGNNETGIIFFGQSAGLVKGNTCAYNKWGIFINATADPKLENNNCYGNTERNLQDNR